MFRHDLRPLFLLALAVGDGFESSAASPQMPAPAEPPPDPFLVVVDRATFAETSLRPRLDTYLQNVQALFAQTALVVQVEAFNPADPTANSAALRELIRAHHRERHITGALLLGRIPYVIWRQAAGCTWVNFGTEDFYFADLDAEFLDLESRYGDRNGAARAQDASGTDALNNQLIPGREHLADGQLDTYQRGRHEGPEIWVARIYAQTIPQYCAYFDKVNAYYAGILQQLAADPAARVTPYTDLLYAGHPNFAPHPDAPKYTFFRDFSHALPGSTYVVLGERTGVTVPDYFLAYNRQAFLYASVDGHADMHVHTLKEGSYTTEDLQTKLQPDRGALIQQLWGCHGNDFRCITDGSMNLAQAYVMGRGLCQASYGSSWTSGTEDTESEILSRMAQGAYLGVAFQQMQARLYAAEHMRTFFASELTHTNWFVPQEAAKDRQMDVLVTKLLRGYNLMGNPFLKITYGSARRSAPTAP